MVQNGRIKPIRGAKVRFFIEMAIAYVLEIAPKGQNTV